MEQTLNVCTVNKRLLKRTNLMSLNENFSMRAELLQLHTSVFMNEK